MRGEWVAGPSHECRFWVVMGGAWCASGKRRQVPCRRPRAPFGCNCLYRSSAFRNAYRPRPSASRIASRGRPPHERLASDTGPLQERYGNAAPSVTGGIRLLIHHCTRGAGSTVPRPRRTVNRWRAAGFGTWPPWRERCGGEGPWPRLAARDRGGSGCRRRGLRGQGPLVPVSWLPGGEPRTGRSHFGEACWTRARPQSGGAKRPVRSRLWLPSPP
jgi:hypothetical protein